MYLGKKNRQNLRKIIIIVVIILTVVSVGTIVYIKAASVKKNTVKAKAIEVKHKTEEAKKEVVDKTEEAKKEVVDKTKVIVKNSNVSEEGKAYAYDALEVQKILNGEEKAITGHKMAFLTFDDGPSTTVTPKVLQILKENGVHATFSLIGECIEENEKTRELVKQEIEQGNAIGNHTYSHNYKILYPNNVVNVSNFMNEVDKTNQILKNILGDNFHTRVIRMPGGHMSWPKGRSALDTAFNNAGDVYIDWNDDDEDSIGKIKNSNEIFQTFKQCDYGQDCLVIIMHDTYGKEATAQALPEIIQYLKGQGYEFRTLE